MPVTPSIVLKPVADEDALFQQVEQAITPWLDRYYLFPIHDETLEDEQAGVTTAIWRDPARPGFELRLVADDHVPMLYISIVPDQRADAATLLADLARHFDVYTPDELVSDVAADAGDVAAWTRLAIALSGRRDTRVERLLLDNLASADEQRLEAGATAAALLRWPSLEAPLRAALARDIPKHVRPALQLALHACERP